jgi:hypothetical protein
MIYSCQGALTPRLGDVVLLILTQSVYSQLEEIKRRIKRKGGGRKEESEFR